MSKTRKAPSMNFGEFRINKGKLKEMKAANMEKWNS